MGTIRIATFNLQDLGPLHVPVEVSPPEVERIRLAHETHIRAVRRTLTRLRADVLALQEVMDAATLRRLISATQYESYEFSGFDPDPAVERQQVILSRFPIRESRLHAQDSRIAWVHTNEGEPVSVQWNRPIVEANVRLPGIGPTTFLALHLKSKRPAEVHGVARDEWGGWPSLAAHAEGSFISALKRVGQALEVRRLVDDLFERYESSRIVVLGDFNDTTDAVPVTIVRGDYVAAQNTVLWDQELYPVELSLPAEKQYTFVHDGQPTMIDHILISRALLPHFSSATVLNESLRDHHSAYGLGVTYPESDHAPVVAEFWTDDRAEKARA